MCTVSVIISCVSPSPSTPLLSLPLIHTVNFTSLCSGLWRPLRSYTVNKSPGHLPLSGFTVMSPALRFSCFSRAGFRRALRPSDWTHFIFTRQHRRHTSSLSSSSLPLAPPFPFILLIQSVIFNLLPLLASELQTSLEMFLVKSAPVSRSSSFSSPYLSDVLKRMSPQHQTTKQDADPSTVYARL